MEPRKLVLSRKGFDSKAGGCPSPIFSDGAMYSLPVPGYDYEEPIHYRDLSHGGINFGEVVQHLTDGRFDGWDLATVDPDVRADALHRHSEWRGLFGQVGAAQRHLENRGVGVGDVFLFFGLFRRIERTQRGWRFVRNAPRQHILWGWLQIEQVCKVDEIRGDRNFDWARCHCQFGWPDDTSNTLYVATMRLDLGDGLQAPGAGVFPRTDTNLVLTEPGCSVSRWRLPCWFYPDNNKTPLSYHPDLGRWRRDSQYTYLRSVGRGQEFVLDLQQYPEGMGWICGLVRDLGAN